MTPCPDRDLLQAYLDGELSAVDTTALEARLCAEPALADALIELTREEAILSEWAHAARAAQAAEAATLPGLPIRRRHMLPRLAAAALATAAAVAGIAFLLGYLANPTEQPSTDTLARLDELHGEVFIVPEHGEPVLARLHQPLQPGSGLRTQGDGFAVVTFADASRLEVGGDTTIRIGAGASAGRQVYLDRGTVAAQATLAPTDSPMVVTTPQAEARFLNTRASFASLAGETRIEQVQGTLQVTRKSDGRRIDVPTNHYAVASEKDAFKSKPLPDQVTQPLALLREKEQTANLSAAYSPDGALLAVGCMDGTIKIWDTAANEVKHTLRGHKKGVKALAFAPVGCLLASGNEERVVKLWDPICGEELATLSKGTKGGIEALAFSPDGARLVTAGGYGRNIPEIRLWNVVSREEEGVIQNEHTNYASAVAFAPDGKHFATGSRDGVVKVWDVYTRLPRQTFTGHEGRINALAYAATGARLASAGKDRTVKVWNLEKGKEELTLPSHASEVRAVAFTPNGKQLASADNSVSLWDAATGREHMTLKGHKGAVAALAFAPDGKKLATAGYDRTVRVWEVKK